MNTQYRVYHNMPFQAVVKAPGFSIGIRCNEKEIVGIQYLEPQPIFAPETLLAKEAARQLGAYLDDPAFDFTLPLRPAGTVFQQKVWQAVQAIACGKSLSYGEVAKAIGSAPRAVGQACGANPYPLIVPCHRVIAADGSLGGFSGHREGFLPNIKRWLLKHEGHRNVIW